MNPWDLLIVAPSLVVLAVVLTAAIIADLRDKRHR